MSKKKEMAGNKKAVLSAVIALLGVCVLVACILVASNISDISNFMKIALIAIGCIVFGVALVIAIILDRGAGYFECQKCQYHFTPKMKDYILGMHFPTRRYLKCPKCGKRSYCKHKFS